MNAALTRTLNKLRQEPIHSATSNPRSTPMYAGPSSSRPMTARISNNPSTSGTGSNFYYPLSGTSKGPLPSELITRRSASSFASNVLPNPATHNRVSTATGPLLAQTTVPIRTDVRPNDNSNIRTSTPIRVSARTVDAGIHQVDGFNFENLTIDEQSERNKVKIKRDNLALRP